MAVFQQVLWGYELTYPNPWVHQTQGAVEAFAAISEALTPDYSGPNSGQILVRCEWNSTRQSIEPIWIRHMGMLASWLGAKKVGSAAWTMGGATGIEAEVVLPTKDQRRLWTGVLEYGWTVMNFVALHLKEERASFEPLATQIISSLRFPPEVAGVRTGIAGLPLPPDYDSMPVQDVLEDVANPEVWRAYNGEAGVDALQAFYLREAPNYGWQISEYIPFPGPSDIGFARLGLKKGGQQVTLGIMPYSKPTAAGLIPARLVFKLE